MTINDNKKVLTWEMARPIVAQKAKQFEAAMTPDVAAGRYRPVGFEPWMASVAADFAKQPKLVECALQAPETVWECLGVASNSGLLVGSAHKQFYLIPRWNGKRQRMECSFIVGYQGMVELAMRHPRVHKVEAFLVYEGEPFSFNPGAGKLTHEWRMDIDRSDEKLVAAYSRVVLTVGTGTVTDPEPLFRVMTRAEILAIRDRSDAWKAQGARSPWGTDFPAMARKTPLRSHCSGGSVPRSVDLIMAVSSEISHETSLVEDGQVDVAKKATGGLRTALGLTPEPESITLPKRDGEFADPIDADLEREANRGDS